MIKGELQGHKIEAKNMDDFRRQIDEIEKKLFAFPEHEETDMTEDQWLRNSNERIDIDIKTSKEAIKLMKEKDDLIDGILEDAISL